MTIKLIDRLLDDIIEKSDIHRNIRIYNDDECELETFFSSANNKWIREYCIDERRISSYEDLKAYMVADYETTLKMNDTKKYIWDANVIRYR